MDTYGSMLETKDCHSLGKLILETATAERIASESVKTPFRIATASWSALGAVRMKSELESEGVERCIHSLAMMAQTTNGKVDASLLQSFLAVVTGPSAVPKRADLAPLLIHDIAHQASTPYKPEVRWKVIQREKPAMGYNILFDTGLREPCSEVGWSHFETTFNELMQHQCLG